MMKSLLTLYEKLLQDMEMLCCVSTPRDLKTISSRIKSEGISFLTITLPAFSKDFERSLEIGRIESSLFVGWKKYSKQRHSGKIPAFLQGFLQFVFDPWTGELHKEVDPKYVFAVRQICLAMKKYRAPCTPLRIHRALESYLLCDLEVESAYSDMPQYKLDVVSDIASWIFSPIFDEFESNLRSDPNIIIGKHGPGTTEDKTLANAKFDSLVWTKRLESLFHACDFLLPSWNSEDRFLGINFLNPEQEPPVRVVTVPKTLKTPRIIAIEPVHMQYVQQGLMEHIVPLLEHRAMYNALGFTDQTVSRNMALRSSLDQSLSTLDLSEASDRVSNEFVHAMLKKWPTLLQAISASRSERARVDGFGVVTLSKFASMGSALCFPIEAMVFLTIAAIAKFDGQVPRYRHKERKVFLSSVRIYGDDIIVPIGLTQALIRELEGFCLKVNTAKSFWNGNFRESCGGDYFNGVDVKPTYIKNSIPESRRSALEIESAVATRNLFYKAGLWKTASHYDVQIQRFAPLPVVTDTSAVLGRFSYLGIDNPVRMCNKLHRPLVFGMVRKNTIPKSPVSGDGALLKFFIKRGNDPYFSKDHLTHYGRPKIAAINLRWASAV